MFDLRFSKLQLRRKRSGIPISEDELIDYLMKFQNLEMNLQALKLVSNTTVLTLQLLSYLRYF